MDKYRKIIRSLDEEPLIFFIPADMFLPWAIILIATLMAKGLLNFSWLVTVCIAGWGMSTWWVLTYKGAWRYLSKFVRRPNWVRGITSYRPLTIEKEQEDE